MNMYSIKNSEHPESVTILQQKNHIAYFMRLNAQIDVEYGNTTLHYHGTSTICVLVADSLSSGKSNAF